MTQLISISWENEVKITRRSVLTGQSRYMFTHCMALYSSLPRHYDVKELCSAT